MKYGGFKLLDAQFLTPHLARLGAIGEHLVHVYGQHEHHTLLEPESHIQWLDGFAGLVEQAREMSDKFQTLAATWASTSRARAAPCPIA